MEAHTEAVSIKLFIHLSLLPFRKKPIYVFTSNMSLEYPDDYVLLEVRTITLDVAIPEAIDVVSRHVAQLQDQKERIAASASMQIAALEDRIQQLLCIEHVPETDHIPF